jgi:hypothetical protein
MAAAASKDLSRSRAWTCVLINQCATPGLGSYFARRKAVGAGQMVLAVAGCTLILVWMTQFFYDVVRYQLGESTPPNPHEWMWRWGVALFGASWIWALVTSISLLQEAKRSDRCHLTNIPPRIMPPPPKPGTSGPAA